jgi:hypothetical protein
MIYHIPPSRAHDDSKQKGDIHMDMCSPIKNDQQAYTRPSFVRCGKFCLPWVILRREGRHDHIWISIFFLVTSVPGEGGVMPLYSIWAGSTLLWVPPPLHGFLGWLKMIIWSWRPSRRSMTHGKQNFPHPDDQIWSPPSMQYDSSHSTVSSAWWLKTEGWQNHCTCYHLMN